MCDIIFAHQERLTLEMIWTIFPKEGFLEKTWFWLFEFTHLAENFIQQVDIIWLYYAKFSGLYLYFWLIENMFLGSRFFGPPGTCLNTYIFMRLGRNTHAIRAICDTRYAIRNTRHTIRETRDTSDTRYAIRWYHLGCAFVGSDLLNVPAAWLVYPSRIKVFESV